MNRHSTSPEARNWSPSAASILKSESCEGLATSLSSEGKAQLSLASLGAAGGSWGVQFKFHNDDDALCQM